MPAYDPKKVSIIWGTDQATMFWEDTMVECSYSQKQFEYQPSVTGPGSRSLNNDRSGTIKVTLHGASPTNDVWMIRHGIDLATGANASPFIIKDPYTPKSSAHGANAWCTKTPDLKKGKAVGPIEWEFYTDDLDLIIGGAPPAQAV